MKHTRNIILLSALLLGTLTSCGQKEQKEFDDPEVEVSFHETFDDLGEKLDEATSKQLRDNFVSKAEEKVTTYRRYYSNYSKDETSDASSNSKSTFIYRIYDDYFFTEDRTGSSIIKENGVETKVDFSYFNYELYHLENNLYIEVKEYNDDNQVYFYVSNFNKRTEVERDECKKRVYQDAVSNLVSWIAYDKTLDIYKAKDGNGYIFIYNNVYEYPQSLDPSKKSITTYQQYIHFNENYELLLETFYYRYEKNYDALTNEKYDDYVTFSENKEYSYVSYGERVKGEQPLNELVAKYNKRRIESAYFNITEIKYEDGTTCDIPGYLPHGIYIDKELKTFECSTVWRLRDLHIGEVHKIRYELEVYIYDNIFSSDYEDHFLLPDLKVKEGQENYLRFDEENSIVELTPTANKLDITFGANLSLDEHGDVEVKDAYVEVEDAAY